MMQLKCYFVGAMMAIMAGGVQAQSLLTIASHAGVAVATTDSILYKPVVSGGKTTLEAFSAAITEAAQYEHLNHGTGVVATNGSYFGPKYSASCSASNTLFNGAFSASYQVDLEGSTNLTTVLDKATAEIRVDGQTHDVLRFSVTEEVTYKITVDASAGQTLFLLDVTPDIANPEPIYFTTGTFTGTLPVGEYEWVGLLHQHAEEIKRASTSGSVNLGLTSSHVKYQIEFTPTAP